MTLSIVIPMFNAEKYIANCLDSLLNQDIDKESYEIIVVNDGSTDRSVKIVEQFISEYPNIILKNQSNKGNGAARNTGVKIATGKYLYFIDADDYVAEDVLSILIEKLDTYDLEILGFKSVVVKNSDLKKCGNFEIKDQELDVTDGISFIADVNYRAEIWWYIINRKFLMNSRLAFYKRKFVQDSYYTPTLFIKADKVSFIDLDVHRYRRNKNSITRKKSPKHVKKHMLDLAFSVEKIHQLQNTISHTNGIKRLKQRKQVYVFFFLARFPKSNMHFKELNEILDKFRSMGAYPMNRFIGKDYNGLKYEISVIVFNHIYLLFPFLFMYRLIYRIIK